MNEIYTLSKPVLPRALPYFLYDISYSILYFRSLKVRCTICCLKRYIIFSVAKCEKDEESRCRMLSFMMTLKPLKNEINYYMGNKNND